MNNSKDELFGKPIKEVLTPRNSTHTDYHANNAFCGAAGPYELKHLNDLVSVLNNDELASLIDKVGISFGGPSIDVNRESLESVIDEADREVFYKEYQAILDSRGYLMRQPVTITELVSQWSQLLTERNDENNERIAYKMVGALAGNDLLWDKWYANNEEPNVSYIFDNVSDLELPDGIFVKDAAERKARWEKVDTHILELKKKYITQS